MKHFGMVFRNYYKFFGFNSKFIIRFLDLCEIIYTFAMSKNGMTTRPIPVVPHLL